jgi:hypothetical protein
MDEHTLGSYTHYTVNKTTLNDSFEIRKAINDRVWFIG